MSDSPKRLYQLKTKGYATFYVLANSETEARSMTEQQWEEWGYITEKGRVVEIEILAEEGQYPDVPRDNSTYLLVKREPTP